MPKISYVVAIYNVADYLDQCIQSLIDQDEKDVEIILVNDGSTDNSLEICRRYEEKDDRIKVIDQENKGANSARNAGLDMAEGRWIHFIDGDDFVLKDVATSLDRYLDSNADVLFFAHSIYKSGSISDAPHYSRKFRISKAEFKEMVLSALNRIGKYKFNLNILDPVSLWNKLYSREFLVKNHLRLDERLPKLQDVTFNIDVFEKAERGLYIPSPGYVYRIVDSSVTHRYQETIIDKYKIINDWFGEFIERHRDDERVVKAYYERIATHMRTCTVLGLCNPLNPASYMKRRKAFMELRASEPYKTSVDKASVLAYRGYKEKILAFAVKYRMFLLCECLNKLYTLIK